MSTIYKFEDLLSFQDINLGVDNQFDTWDLFGEFNPKKKRLDNLLSNVDFLEEISSVIQVNSDEEGISITGNTLDVINCILRQLDKEENYTWPELAATCFFLGRNLDAIIGKLKNYVERKHNPHTEKLDIVKESMKKVEDELIKLQSDLELLRDAGII